MIYIPALNGLRAVACIAVVLFHSKVGWAGGGYLGVDVFFVLSGYLTVTILNRCDGRITMSDVAKFLERRVMRILPLLAVVCLTVGLALTLTSNGAQIAREIMQPLGFYSNFALAAGGGPELMGHSWSVSSEMQFYMVIALVFACVWRLRRSILLPLFLGVFVAVTGFRFLAFYDGDAWFSIYFSPVLRVSGLFLGAAIALLPVGISRRMAPLGWIGFAGIILAFTNAVYYSALSFTIWSTCVEIATAVLILSLASNPSSSISRALSGSRIEKLGLWSYGIYLWHNPIARVLRDFTTPEATAFLTLAICLPLSALTYQLVEQRYRYLRFSGGVLRQQVSS